MTIGTVVRLKNAKVVIVTMDASVVTRNVLVVMTGNALVVVLMNASVVTINASAVGKMNALVVLMNAMVVMNFLFHPFLLYQPFFGLHLPLFPLLHSSSLHSLVFFASPPPS